MPKQQDSVTLPPPTRTLWQPAFPALPGSTWTNDSVTTTPMPRPPAWAPARFVAKPTTTSIAGQGRDAGTKVKMSASSPNGPCTPWGSSIDLQCLNSVAMYTVNLQDPISEASGPRVSALFRNQNAKQGARASKKKKSTPAALTPHSLRSDSLPALARARDPIPTSRIISHRYLQRRRFCGACPRAAHSRCLRNFDPTPPLLCTAAGTCFSYTTGLLLDAPADPVLSLQDCAAPGLSFLRASASHGAVGFGGCNGTTPSTPWPRTSHSRPARAPPPRLDSTTSDEPSASRSVCEMHLDNLPLRRLRTSAATLKPELVTHTLCACASPPSSRLASRPSQPAPPGFHSRVLVQQIQAEEDSFDQILSLSCCSEEERPNNKYKGLLLFLVRFLRRNARWNRAANPQLLISMTWYFDAIIEI
ncbi:hypothetical protein DFH06DRAFT_1408021 [Mycena polygramma]|nr:hypothetical protein DFH06DRAFT_1408021 [Mycena polygramma]